MIKWFDRRLTIVSGKGGTGKSTIATAMALRAASAGKRTLLCEVNAPQRINSAWATGGPFPAEIEQRAPNLWVVNLRPEESMREYVMMKLKFERLYKAFFQNRWARYFLKFIPALQELVLLGKILYHVQEEASSGGFKYERLIVDAPATGHALSFLKVPQVILDTVPPGILSREAFQMRQLLIDPEITGAVLVALPEEMPVNETLELYTRLKDEARITTSAVVLNQCISERFSQAELELLQKRSPQLGAMGKRHHARSARSQFYQDILQTKIPTPLLSVPYLFRSPFDGDALETVARCLTESSGTIR